MVTAARQNTTHGPRTAIALITGALSILIVATISGGSLKLVAPAVALVVAAAISYRVMLAWRSLVSLIVLVILFIPIKRYVLPASLPFQLEPYRLVVFLICLGWATSLLIDPRVRLRRTPFDAPLFAYLACIGFSLLANPRRVTSLFQDVFKSLLFFASFILVVYLVVSVVRRRREIEAVVSALTIGGTCVALAALVESRIHYNIFDHLTTVMPFLHFTGSVELARSGRLRVIASAQHPIALGAALVMLIPLAIYRARATGRRRWWAATLVLLIGALGTSSRTAITMLLAIGVVYMSLHARDMKRMWPALIPALVVIHFAIPGALGTTYSAFFPKGGLIAQQQDAPAGHARLSTLGPALRGEVAKDPVFGEGFATRITTPSPSTPTPNAPILDDQWLGVLCETGVAGMFALSWLFVRFVRRLRREAKRDPTPRQWLLTGLAASVAGYAVGMLTYDAFSFIQVTFLLFIFLGLGASVLNASPDEWETPDTAAKPVPGATTGARGQLKLSQPAPSLAPYGAE
jgi:polysaccharide biosynthesis protein PslJ